MPTLALTIGALEIGSFFSTVLYGVVTVQLYLYLVYHFRDPLWIRILVWSVWILDTAYTVLSWVQIYSSTVTFFGDPKAVIMNTIPRSVLFPIGGLISAIVQSFSAYKIHKYSHRWLIPTVLWIGSIIRAGVQFSLCIVSLRSSSTVSFLRHYLRVVEALVVFSVVLDWLTTSSVWYYLFRERPYFKRSQMIIQRLVMLSIETMLITSVFGIAVLITAFLYPLTWVDFGIYTCYPQLFSNSFFVSLNARHALRQIDTGYPQCSIGNISVVGTTREGEINVELSSHPPPDNRIVSTETIPKTDPIDQNVTEFRIEQQIPQPSIV